MDEGFEGDSTEDVWTNEEKKWGEKNEAFRKLYVTSFPDAIGGLPIKYDHMNPEKGCRRFPCNSLHPQTRAVVPLPAYLCPIIIPQVNTKLI